MLTLAPMNLHDLEVDMRHGFQTSGISFWKHGEMVAARFRDLMRFTPKMEWRLPPWFEENRDWIRDRLSPDVQDILTYQLWHDCGKPYCRTIGEDGKIHYPDHAAISESVWLRFGGDPRIGRWIGKDMLCHTLRPSEAEEFARDPDALILLTTALCEVHANAEMFGGFESESFKIKAKRLSKCGKTIITKSEERQHDQLYKLYRQRYIPGISRELEEGLSGPDGSYQGFEEEASGGPEKLFQVNDSTCFRMVLGSSARCDQGRESCQKGQRLSPRRGELYARNQDTDEGNEQDPVGDAEED